MRRHHINRSSSSIEREWEAWAKGRGGTEEIPPLASGLPKLTISLFAYCKFQYLVALSGKNEISGFGVATDPSDLLRVTDFYVPGQEVSGVSSDMDDGEVANMFVKMGAAGIAPQQCGRIWMHCHPGNSDPSTKDMKTAKESLGTADWFVMAIQGTDGLTATLYYTTPVPLQTKIDVTIDYLRPGFPSHITGVWKKVFDRQVRKELTWMEKRDLKEAAEAEEKEKARDNARTRGSSKVPGIGEDYRSKYRGINSVDDNWAFSSACDDCQSGYLSGYTLCKGCLDRPQL
jgi:hypothetical protein